MPYPHPCRLPVDKDGPACGLPMVPTSSVWIADGTEVIAYHCDRCDRNPKDAS